VQYFGVTLRQISSDKRAKSINSFRHHDFDENLKQSKIIEKYLEYFSKNEYVNCIARIKYEVSQYILQLRSRLIDLGKRNNDVEIVTRFYLPDNSGRRNIGWIFIIPNRSSNKIDRVLFLLHRCSPNVYPGQTIDWSSGASYFQSTRDNATFIPSITTTTMIIIYSRESARQCAL